MVRYVGVGVGVGAQKANEAISAASLAASAALAEVEGRGPTEAPARLGERHKLITGLQVGWGRGGVQSSPGPQEAMAMARWHG